MEYSGFLSKDLSFGATQKEEKDPPCGGCGWCIECNFGPGNTP